MNIKKIFFNNKGLKTSAFLLALFVWVMISGRERTYLERSFEINVENQNVSQMIDVHCRPAKVRVVIRGTSKEIGDITGEDLKLHLDLDNVNDSTRFSIFTEDYLKIPENIEIVSINPKMIEVTVKEFYYKEVPVRVLYSGRMPKGVSLIERKIIPEKVRIFGYKSQIMNINTVFAVDKIDLSKVTENKTLTIPLDKGKGILRFEDSENVSISLIVKNIYEKRNSK
ncbi:MAG: CdaR family protein [Acidobacteriota bacterium]